MTGPDATTKPAARAVCPACLALAGESRLWGEKNGFALVECGKCGHKFVRDVPSEAELAAYYSGPYFTDLVYYDYERDRRVLQKNFRRFLDIVKRDHGGDKLVEFGSAYGFFLDLARESFTCQGVEVSKPAADVARSRGHAVSSDPQVVAQELAGAANVVAMWDTIEHLSDLDKAFSAIAYMLAPGGSVYLTTGDVGSKMAQKRGLNWRLVDPPQHLHYFTQGSLAALAKRYGLKVENVCYLPHSRSARAMLNLLGQKRGGVVGACLRGAAKCVPSGMSVALNFNDIMFARLVRA